MEAVPPDSHLSLPINIEECEDLLLLNTGCYNHQHLINLKLELGVTSTIYERCPDPWGCLTTWVSLLRFTPPPLAELIQASVKSLKAEVSYFSKGQVHADLTPDPRVISQLQPLFSLKFKADRLKSKIRKRWAGNVLMCPSAGEIYNLYYHATVSFFICKKHGPSILPTTLVLGVLDSCQRRFSGLFYVATTDTIPKYSFPLLPRTLQLDQLLIDLRSVVGESFFTLMNSWHAIVTGTIISRDQDLGCDALWRTVMTTLREVFGDMFPTSIIALMIGDCSTVEGLSASLELTGLAKAYGHPCIKTRAGMATMREFACAPKKVQVDVGETISANFKYHFTKNYFRIHGCWPPVQVATWGHGVLRRAVGENTWPQGGEMRKLCPKDWAAIALLQALQFDYCLDGFDLLGDKACAQSRSKWPQVFDVCGFRLHHNTKRPKTGERDETRVIVRYLQGSENEPLDVINRVNARDLDPEDDIIIVCPKEGEEKEEGRMFAKLTYRRRLYQVITEKNIVPILKYIPYQSMTISELELKKKIGIMANQTTGGKKTVVVFELDYKKFNMQWRGDMVLRLFQDFDNIYGFNYVYADTHPGFHRSLVITNLRTRPPRPSPGRDPYPSDYCHYYQAGGQEGLRQKGWTVATQMLILDFAYQNRYKIHLLGQGDNQVLLWYPTHAQEADLHNTARLFLEELEAYMEAAQLPLKAEETWFSRHLVQYNKESYYKGVHIPNAIKFAVKISPDSNEILDTFDNKVAAIATGAEATANHDKCATGAYLSYALEIILLAHSSQLLSPHAQLQDYAALPMWNRVIGGLPGSSFLVMTQRGVGDRLTYQLGLLQFLRRTSPQLFTSILRLSPCSVLPSPAYKLLVMDPSALNIEASLNVEPEVRRHVRDAIDNLTSNPQVRSILDTTDEARANLLVNILVTLRPYHGRISAELFRCSNAGILIMLCGLFEKTRTLLSITSQHSATCAGKGGLLKLVRDIESAWLKKIQSLWTRDIKGGLLISTLNAFPCSYLAARHMRRQSWGFEIEGVTSPCPIEQVLIHPWTDVIGHSEERSFIIQTSHTFRLLGLDSWQEAGPFSAYYGSSTQEKLRRPANSPLEVTTQVKSARRLGTIISWADYVGSPSLREVALWLLGEKKIDITGFVPEVRGGNIYHRFHTASDRMSSLVNCISSLNSHMVIGTSQMAEFASGGGDFTIFFQSLFLYGLSFTWQVYGRMKQLGIPRLIAVTLHCQGCTQPVPTETLKFSSLLMPTLLATDGSNLPVGDTTWETVVSGDIVLGCFVGRRFALSALTYDQEIGVDNYMPALIAPGGLGGVVTIPEFRNSNPHAVIWAMLVRYDYLYRWMKDYGDGVSLLPLVPTSLCSFAGALIKSGLLPTYCNLMRLTPPHLATTSPNSLSHSLPLGFFRYLMYRGELYSRFSLIKFPKESEKRLRKSLARVLGLVGIDLPPESQFDTLPDVEVVECQWAARNIKADMIMYTHTEERFGSRQVWKGASLCYRRTLMSAARGRLEIPWPLYHLSRGCGRISSAASKYVQVLGLPCFPPSFDLIISLAEGCGGVLSTLLHKYPKARGIFNTLITDSELSQVEPILFVPAALLGCDLTQRVCHLKWTIGGDTDLRSSSVVTPLALAISDLKGPLREVLITMDAEGMSCHDSQSIAVTIATISQLVEARGANVSLITKWFLPYIQEELISTLSGYNKRTITASKPVSSTSLNSEVFLHSSTNKSHALRGVDEIGAVMAASVMMTSQLNIDELISCGKDLAQLHSCCNLAATNLGELLGFHPSFLDGPQVLIERIKHVLNASWESFDDDPVKLHMLRVSGRLQAIARMVVPLVLLLEMWGSSGSRICYLFRILSDIRITIQVKKDQPGWPSNTFLTVVVERSMEPSAVTAYKDVLKKVARAFLALPGIPEGVGKPTTCLTQLIASEL
ncbi:RNA-dependent RNA polymerase [Hubei orthoptera virus 5]|uniref:RNA-directed RNA polymerase n=1 Tax=Hubei orthoptera virus 5 TaxID=1923013 RepID=A0A1L3KN72_9MONO|nr:RNA-dependent RNA polymerase [Hubei orthoptera virus 5]APG78861.1 RNA-dependent RNA polymerase [Hubei orthoptera virus 5]